MTSRLSDVVLRLRHVLGVCVQIGIQRPRVMDALVISFLYDNIEESVGSHAPRVILFSVIPTIIPDIPEIPIVPPDPIVTPKYIEDSLPPVPDLPLVSPFLCSDDTEADGEPAEQRPVSLSHDTLSPLTEFPLAPVVAPPEIHRRPSLLIRPGEAIPFGRLYRTHLNGPRKLLTVRKRVIHIPARRLAWRRVSHHSSDRYSSPDSSSSSAPDVSWLSVKCRHGYAVSSLLDIKLIGSSSLTKVLIICRIVDADRIFLKSRQWSFS
ncbi:hypothetical protein Tco_0007656 [Tanacetum coccineum]